MRWQTVHALPEKVNLTRIGNERAAGEIEQGCLTRPVRPHHPEDLAGFNSQADVLDRGDAAKTLGDFIESEKRH